MPPLQTRLSQPYPAPAPPPPVADEIAAEFARVRAAIALIQFQLEHNARALAADAAARPRYLRRAY